MMHQRTVAEIKANDEANYQEHLRHVMEMEEEARKKEAATSEKEESFEEWNRKYNAECEADHQ